MKRTWTRKIVSLIILGVMCLSVNVSASQAAVQDVSTQLIQGDMAPRFTYIVSAYTSLVLNSGGRLTCMGDTQVWPGNDAAITVELQQYKNGRWSTIKSWYYSDSEYASSFTDWYVASGYSYRLMNTHQALLSGNVTETCISYSDVIYY